MSRFASNHRDVSHLREVTARTESPSDGPVVDGTGEPLRADTTADEARALRRMIDEIRDAEPPELDWARLEQSLLKSVAQEQQVTRAAATRVRASWAPLLGFAAAAAALIMMVAHGSGQHLAGPAAQSARAVDVSTLTPVASQPGELPTYDAAEVGTSALLQSADEPLRFQVRGVATWVLEPHSQALVRAGHAPYLIELKQGGMHAEVVPQKSNDQLLETFAVEVGGTRVAVHGTVFSVTRRGADMSVEVTRGAVTVGPGGHRGITTGHLLVGPAHAAFSLDGGRQAHMLPMTPEAFAVAAGPSHAVAAALSQRSRSAQLTPSAADEPAAALNAPPQHPGPDPIAAAAGGSALALIPTAPPSHTASANTPQANGNGPVEPNGAGGDTPLEPTGPPALTAGQAQALVVGCLSQAMNTSVAKDTVLMVSSQMSVNLDGEGNVTSVRFNPPLKPSLQQRCASVLFGRKIEGGPQVRFDVRVSRR